MVGTVELLRSMLDPKVYKYTGNYSHMINIQGNESRGTESAIVDLLVQNQDISMNKSQTG